MECELHGVIYRRAQWLRDAKPDGETASREKQAARKEKSFWLEGCDPSTHPRVVLPRSAEAIQNKRVECLMRAKIRKKSAQECDQKRDRSKIVCTFECPHSESLK